MTEQTVPPAIIKAGMHYQVPVEGLTSGDRCYASVWTDDDPEVAERHAALHDRLAAAYRLLASKLEDDRQDAARQPRRQELLARLLPEAHAANNLPSLKHMSVFDRRALDRIIELEDATPSPGLPVTPEQLAKLNPGAVLRSTAGRLYVQCTDQKHLRQTEEGTYTHAEVLEREPELILLWEPA